MSFAFFLFLIHSLASHSLRHVHCVAFIASRSLRRVHCVACYSTGFWILSNKSRVVLVGRTGLYPSELSLNPSICLLRSEKKPKYVNLNGL